MILCPDCSTQRPDGIEACPICKPALITGADGPRCPEVPVGTVLSRRYQVQAKASSGEEAVSVVYVARDLITELDVALKFPPLLISGNEQYLRLFCQEATVCLRLTHEHIVRLWNLEHPLAGGIPFLVMEYVPGPSLGRVLFERFQTTGSPTVRLGELLAILPGLARALDYAHSLKIIHRDIKPSNILLTGSLDHPDTIAKLADFGIAAQIRTTVSRHASLHSEDGTTDVPGTLPYMSTEQVLGKDLTPSSDIYSLAATIYHLLAGRPPFSGNAVDLLYAITARTPEPISGLSSAANATLIAALSKQREERPLTVKAFVEGLIDAIAIEDSSVDARDPASELAEESAMQRPSLAPIPLVPSTRGEIPRAASVIVRVPATSSQWPKEEQETPAGPAPDPQKSAVVSETPPKTPDEMKGLSEPPGIAMRGPPLPSPVREPASKPPPVPLEDSPPPQWPADPIERYNLGTQLAQEGRPGEAVAAFRGAVEIDFRLQIAWYKRRSPLGTQLNWDQVTQSFQRATEADPTSVNALLDLGFALAKQRRWDEAIRAYQRTTTLNPDKVQLWVTLADALCRAHKFPEAETAARRALKDAPDSGPGWYCLARALGGQTQWQEAELAIRKALEIDPKNPLIRAKLADVLNWQKRWEEAADACRSAIQIHDQYARAWDSLGIALGGLGLWAEAETAVRRGLEADDSDHVIWGNLADALNWQGRWKEAEDTCRTLLKLKESYGKGWNSLGVALGGQGRWKEAEDALRRSLDLTPRNAEAWSNLASALNWQSKWSESIIACRRAIDLSPRMTSAWENLGFAEERSGNLEEAETAYTRVIHLAPSSAMARDGLKRIRKGS